MNQNTLPFEPQSKIAYLRALLPGEYSELSLRQLFHVGMDEFRDDGDVDLEMLLDAVGTFGHQALEWDDGVLPKSAEPPASTPGGLAVVATYAIIRTKEYPRFKGDLDGGNSGHGILPLANIRDYYGNCLVNCLHSEPTDKTDTILVELATELYQKDDSVKGPTYTGPVVTGFRTFDDDPRRHIEVPIAAASMDILNFTSDYYREIEADIRFANNCLYLPIETLTDDWREALQWDFKHLIDIQEGTLTNGARKTLVAEENQIVSKLESYKHTDGGGVARFYRGRTEREETIKCLKAALVHTGHDIDTWYTVAQIQDAVDEYEPNEESEWRLRYLEKFDSWEALSHFLQENLDSYKYDGQKRDGGRAEYLFSPDRSGQFRELDIEHPEEVLGKLPCFANMYDQLEQTGPTRKELYSFVRLTFWLEPFFEEADNDGEKGTILIDKAREALHETFQNWDWYDSDITDEEIDMEYEMGERRKGRYLPMGCDNPTMQPYCIGKENCPYSIYSSLPFVEEMYEKRDEQSERQKGDTGFD
jgi:hypothetical protein